MPKNLHILMVMLPFLFTVMIPYSHAESDDIAFTARPTTSVYSAGEFPTIVGVIKDDQGQPLENVKVSASFFSHSISTTTNNVGSYLLKSPVTAQPGQHSINVIATKDGLVRITSVSFEIQGKSPEIIDIPTEIQTTIETIPKSLESIPSAIGEGITNNPVSNAILEQIDSQKKFFEEKNNELAYAQFLDEQRRIAHESLQKDLQSFNEQYEVYLARAAFSDFVNDVDETVQDIFWGQFAVTEQLTNDAHQAKLDALEDGQTSEQAMNVFQRKAAITYEELVNHNEELNIKYGHTDQSTQDQFNEKGKLPREK